MVALFPAGGGVLHVEGRRAHLTKRIVCLANSFKQGGTCIAGREVLADGFGAWVRPIGPRKTGELWLSECLYSNNEFPQLLDVMDLPLLEPAPSGHQTENYVVDPAGSWVKVGVFPRPDVGRFAEHPASLWIDRDHTKEGILNCVSAREAAKLDTSLVLIRAVDASVEAGAPTWPGSPTKSWWMTFGYKGRKYRLKVTDPDVRSEGSRGGVFICVSLTLPFSGDGRCHKLVAAVLNER